MRRLRRSRASPHLLYEIRNDPVIQADLRAGQAEINRRRNAMPKTPEEAATAVQAKADKYARDLARASTAVEAAEVDSEYWTRAWEAVRTGTDPGNANDTRGRATVEAAALVYRAYHLSQAVMDRVRRDLEWIEEGDY